MSSKVSTCATDCREKAKAKSFALKSGEIELWRGDVKDGDGRVAAYASENPDLSYRDLRDAFRLSLGALSKILKSRQNPKASRVSFLVRYERGGEKVLTVVTVRGRATTEQKRLRLTELYKTGDVAVGDDPSISWRTEYTAWDLGLRGRHKIGSKRQR